MRKLLIISIILLALAASADAIRWDQITLDRDVESQIHGVTPGTSTGDVMTIDQGWLKLNKTGGTITGDINANGRWIYGLGAPGNDSDASTKAYVDTATSAKAYADAAVYVKQLSKANKTGEEFTGHLGLNVSSPHIAFNIRANNAFTYPMLALDSTSGGAILSMKHPYATNPWTIVAGNTIADDFAISADDDGSDIRFYIDEVGNIGIGGDYDPDAPLDVAGDIRSDGAIQLLGIGTQSAPAANEIKLYSKTGIPYYRNASGEYVLSGGAVSGGSGDVNGPASSVANNFASFADTGGKTLTDSGYDATEFVTVSGDTMAGALAMGTYKVTGLGNGTQTQDAATQVLAAHGTAYVRKEGSNYISTLATGADYQTGTDPDTIVNALFDYYADYQYVDIEIIAPLTGCNAVIEFHSDNSTLRFCNVVSGTGGLLKISCDNSKIDFLTLTTTTDAAGRLLEINGDYNIITGTHIYGAGFTNPTGILVDGGDRNVITVNRIYNVCYGFLLFNGSQNIVNVPFISYTNYAIRLWSQNINCIGNGNMFSFTMINGCWGDGVSIEGAPGQGGTPNNFEGNFFKGSVVGATNAAFRIGAIADVDSLFTMVEGCADALSGLNTAEGSQDIVDEGQDNNWNMNYARAANITIASQSHYKNMFTGEMKMPTWTSGSVTNGCFYFYDQGTTYQIAVYDQSAAGWKHTNLVA